MQVFDLPMTQIETKIRGFLFWPSVWIVIGSGNCQSQELKALRDCVKPNLQMLFIAGFIADICRLDFKMHVH